MISKISRGSDTAGLLRYLLGPGRANEHTNPHLIASWDGDPTALEPGVVNGRPQVRALAALLDQPLDALPRDPVSTVWHCSLRNAPDDRRLSDEEWAQVARHVLDRVGLARVGDTDACRWIAARHGDDHIHLLVTLARQDGVPARTSNDYRRAGRACQALEHRLDLTRTRDRDSTAARRPTRAEAEKALRGGRRESPRETLRREVCLASMTALDPDAFLGELQRGGLLVKPRYSTQDVGHLTGYAVAWPGDYAAGGEPVWFSGSSLAPDLSLPRLQNRWQGVREEVALLRSSLRGTPPPRPELAPVLRALARVTAATGATGETARLTHTAAWALVAVARAREGYRGGPLTGAGDALVSGLNRTGESSGTGGEGERMMLAAGHLVLQASKRSVPVEVLHLEHLLLTLLRGFAHSPVSRPRPQVAVEGAMTRRGGLSRPDALAALSAARVSEESPQRRSRQSMAVTRAVSPKSR